DWRIAHPPDGFQNCADALAKRHLSQEEPSERAIACEFGRPRAYRFSCSPRPIVSQRKHGYPVRSYTGAHKRPVRPVRVDGDDVRQRDLLPPALRIRCRYPFVSRRVTGAFVKPCNQLILDRAWIDLAKHCAQSEGSRCAKNGAGGIAV